MSADASALTTRAATTTTADRAVINKADVSGAIGAIDIQATTTGPAVATIAAAAITAITTDHTATRELHIDLIPG